MSFDKEHRSLFVPEYWSGDAKEHARRIAYSVNQILRGMTNNHYTVTLECDKTETNIPYEASRPGVSPLLTPQSASAAAAMAAGKVYVEASNGNVKIVHDADPATDRTYSLVIIG